MDSATTQHGSDIKFRKKKPRKLKKISVKSASESKLPVVDLLSKAVKGKAKSIFIPGERLRIPENGELGEESDEDGGMFSIGSPCGSFRSFDGSSMGSEGTLISKFSTKELIHKMAVRAEKNLEPPDFVPRLNELDPIHVTWKKKRYKSYNKENPKVDIIGCMHPVELILAKADKRLRQQVRTNKAREVKEDERVEKLNALIDFKYSRAERYAAAAAWHERQLFWLKAVSLLLYLKRLRPEYEHNAHHTKSMQDVVRCALKINKVCASWYRKHVFFKVTVSFLKMLNKHEFLWRMQMRVKRKRRAVHRIKTFLAEYKGHHKMNVVVHRYLTAVRKVQHSIRDFLACKHAKIETLGRLWERLEIKYVMKMLEKRKQMQRKGGGPGAGGDGPPGLNRQASMKNQSAQQQEARRSSMSINTEATARRGSTQFNPDTPQSPTKGFHLPPMQHQNSTSSIDSIGAEPAPNRSPHRQRERHNGVESFASTASPKGESLALIEMKNQSKLWLKIDHLMEEKIKELRTRGVITSEDPEDAARKVLVPIAMRNAFIRDLIEYLRKEFYTSQKAIIRRQIEAEATFSESHANDLLMGRTADINRIIDEKFNKKLINLKYKPFMLFSALNNKLVCDKIKEAHKVNETFAIKIEHFNNAPKVRRPNNMRLSVSLK